MSEAETILRIAARGDGITQSGRHVPRSAPGDIVAADGTLEPGPHHVVPPCRHFSKCGACDLQQCDDTALAQFVTDRVVLAAAGQGLEAELVAPAYLSPPNSRRRATLHAGGARGNIRIGFREANSHRIVDIRECHVLTPELFALVQPLRKLLSQRRQKIAADIQLTLTDQGVACAIGPLEIDGLQETEAMLEFARAYGLARLSIDQGYGEESFWEPEPVTVTLGGVAVAFPAGAFLQATRDGEQALVAAAREWLADSAPVADLFAGLGTFAFSLADRPVVAVEAARDAHLACRAAAARHGLPLEARHRDLFRNPLQADELAPFAAVLLDPPRAGAREQVARLVQSRVERIVYISCNPASWARDAKLLVDAGFKLAELRPIGQFRWSTHVELASLLVR